MALADVKTKIEDDARKQADEILEKAKKQAEEIISKAQEEAQKIQEEWMRQAKEERENIFKRREIVADLDLGKIELSMKRSLIEETLTKARKKMNALDPKKYASFVETVLKTAVKESEKSEGLIYVGEEEAIIDEEWVSNFNQKNDTKLSLADEKLPFRGGFILNVGDIDINCSFDMLIASIQDELELIIAGELFSD